MSAVKDIRALHRGLRVLEVLNSFNGSTLTEVTAQAKLPKATTYRILENLCRAGYVVRDSADNRYRLTIMVRRLAQGFDDAAWLTEVARPLMHELGRKVVYPVALTTLYGTSMLARETTDHQSALALDQYAAGTLLPIFTSGSGKVYLAFCSESEREALLNLCRKSQSVEHRFAHDPKFIERIINEVRHNGYALGLRQKTRAEGKTSALAVPVMSKGQMLAALAVRYIDSALTPEEAVSRFLEPLKACARHIGQAVAQAGDDERQDTPPPIRLVN